MQTVRFGARLLGQTQLRGVGDTAGVAGEDPASPLG